MMLLVLKGMLLLMIVMNHRKKKTLFFVEYGQIYTSMERRMYGRGNTYKKTTWHDSHNAVKSFRTRPGGINSPS